MLFGNSKTIANEEPRVGALRIQSSAYGLCIPLMWGTTRLSGNLIWYGDFTATAHTTVQEVGGKGGGGNTVTTFTTYTYATALALGLCEGAVEGIGQVWSGKNKTTMSDIGSSAFLGTYTQSPWSFLTSKHPTEALNYPGLAYIANSALDLGGSPLLPNMSFEVKGARQVGSGVVDASPGGIVTDFLTDPNYGAGFPSANLGDLTQYQNYTWAMGLFLSPAITQQAPAQEHLKQIAEMTNSAVVWSEGKLKLRPYGDAAVTGHGVTYTPDITPVFDLTDDDFIPISEDEVIIVRRKNPADAFNHVQVEFRNRALDYNLDIAAAKDQANIAQVGMRTADPARMHAICDAAVADTIAQLKLQRDLYIRNEYEFRLGWRFCLLEPMDIVTLTHVSGALALSLTQVRIKSIEEDEDGQLTVVAEEFPFGNATPAQITTQAPGGYTVDLNVAPGNAAAPVMFEPPISLAGRPEIWMATSGGDTWGGCEVWVSLDDATYSKVGQTAGGARHGQLTALLAAGSDPDTSHTLSVDLTTSRGILTGGTTTDRDLYNTLCYVDGELISFASAALTAPNAYNLTSLRRGAYGSPIGSHASGTKFARLDQAIFKYPYDPALLGQTLYIKLRSYNSFGGARQDLASLTPYTFTTAGAPVGGIGGVYSEQPFTGRSAKIKWPAMTGALGYRIEVWAETVKRRTVDATDTRYEYTFEDAKADGGPWRTLQFRVFALTATGISDTAALLELTNSQIGAPTSVAYGELIEGFGISCAKPADTDYAGCRVWYSLTSGFDPATTAPAYDGPDTFFTAYGLTANADYYVRIGLYDVFGTDGMTLSSELHIIPRGFTYNPHDTLASINTLLTDGSGTDKIIMLADRFAIKAPDTDRFPFAVVDAGGGAWKVLLDADVLIGGNVDIANLRTGSLPSDVIMRLGGGTVELDGMGEIRVYAATGVNQDFVRLTSAQITFLRYITGTGYVTYNYLSRIESGIANNGDTVTIPGYWKAQPKVQVSPSSLGVFKASYAAQDQAIACSAASLAETSPGSGQWQFVATANLQLAAGAGSSAVGTTSGLLTATTTWTSGNKTTPANCTTVTPSVTLTSIRWTGTGVVYANRQVRWRVRYTGDAGGGSWRTKAIGSQLLAVSDSYTFTFPSAGTYTFWLEFVAEDATGTFSATGVVYDTSTGSVSTSTPTTTFSYSMVGNGSTATNSITLPSYTPPAGWSIVNTTYSYSIQGSLGKTGNGTIRANTPAGVAATNTTPFTTPTYTASPSFTAAGFSTTACTAFGSASGTAGDGWSYSVKFNSASATINLQRPQGASASGNNTFNYDSYSYVLTSATVLSTGTINWLAIGE